MQVMITVTLNISKMEAKISKAFPFLVPRVKGESQYRIVY